MHRSHARCHRPAFNWSGLLIVVFILAMLIGLLIPTPRRVRIAGPRSQSQNNLKQLGLAIHNQASAHNGEIWVGAMYPKKGKGGFFIELLPFMEGDTIYNNIGGSDHPYPSFKPYYAPLDPLNDPTQPGLSYALNGYFINRGTTSGGAFQPVDQGGVDNGLVKLPDSFKERGTSNIVAIAERTANNKRTYYGTDIYFSPPHISSLPATSAGFNFAEATAFSASGVQVAMMDGSVRTVAVQLRGKVSGDNSAFDIACSLNSPTPLPPEW